MYDNVVADDDDDDDDDGGGGGGDGGDGDGDDDGDDEDEDDYVEEGDEKDDNVDVAEDEMEVGDIEDDEVKGGENDDVENDGVEEEEDDDVEDDDVGCTCVHDEAGCSLCAWVGPDIFSVNSRIKWLLWNVQVHVDCAGSRKVCVAVLGSFLSVDTLFGDIFEKCQYVA